MRHTRFFVGLIALMGFSAIVQADDITYSATITNAAPTYNRPLAGNPPSGLSGVGTNVFYHLQPFYVNVSDSYTIATTAAVFTPGTIDDTFVVLYQTAFNPASPLTNALQADDDSGPGALSLFSRPLVANTQYFLVTSHFANANIGDFTLQISNATAGNTAILGFVAVPEPTTWALIGACVAGAGGFGYRRLRLKNMAKKTRYARK